MSSIFCQLFKNILDSSHPFSMQMRWPAMRICWYTVQFSCFGNSHAQSCSSFYIHTCHHLQVLILYKFSMPEWYHQIKISMLISAYWELSASAITPFSLAAPCENLDSVKISWAYQSFSAY